MKKLLISTSIAALCTLSMSTVLYADNDSGFYLGIGVQKSNFERNSLDTSETKGNLSAGYMFNDRWGIDGTLYNFIDEKKSSTETIVAGLALTGVYKVPVSSRIDVYGKAGIIRTGIEMKKDNVTVVDDAGQDFIVGIGAKYDMGKHNILMEYNKIDPSDARLNVISIGYRYEF